MTTWEYRQLGTIGKWGSGGTPDSGNVAYYGGSIPWVVIEDLNDDVVTSTAKTLTELGVQNSSANLLAPGTLLIAMYGSIGKLGITGMQCATNQAIASCQPDPEQVDLRYLFYYLRASRNELALAGNGVTQQNISQGFLKEFSIPLPSLPEQRRIAAMLRAADDERRRRRYTQSLSDGLLREVFVRMFGDLEQYQQVPFRDLAANQKSSFVNGPFGSDLLTTELVDSGVPVIYIRDIASGYYQRVSQFFVTQDKALQLDFCRVDAGDVLIAKVGDPPGIAVVYPDGEESGIVTQDVIRVKPRMGVITPQYLVAFLNSHAGRNRLFPIIVEGTRERFGLTPLKEVLIPIPPRELQCEYTTIAAEHEQTRRQQQESARQSDHLFETLLHRAFAGEL